MDGSTKEKHEQRSAIDIAIRAHLNQKDKRSDPVKDERREKHQQRLAIDIARIAHAHQKDKQGKDVVEHPIAVAGLVYPDEDTICAAFLHDVIEDTAVTLENLRDYGVAENIVVAVDCLTWRDGESERDYLKRVASNVIAYKVKIADMCHNSSDERNPISVFGKKVVSDRKKKYRSRTDFLRDERKKVLIKQKTAERLLRKIELGTQRPKRQLEQ